MAYTKQEKKIPKPGRKPKWLSEKRYIHPAQEGYVYDKIKQKWIKPDYLKNK